LHAEGKSGFVPSAPLSVVKLSQVLDVFVMIRGLVDRVTNRRSWLLSIETMFLVLAVAIRLFDDCGLSFSAS